MWIEEIKKELKGRKLDIWRGHDLEGKPLNISLEQQEKYRQKWRDQVEGKLIKDEPLKREEPKKCRYISEENPLDRAGCPCARKWVYECEIYGACTPEKEREDRTAICEGCKFYKGEDQSEDDCRAPTT